MQIIQTEVCSLNIKWTNVMNFASQYSSIKTIQHMLTLYHQNILPKPNNVDLVVHGQPKSPSYYQITHNSEGEFLQ